MKHKVVKAEKSQRGVVIPQKQQISQGCCYSLPYMTELKSEIEELNKFVNNRIEEIKAKYHCELMELSEKFEDKGMFYLVAVVDESKM